MRVTSVLVLLFFLFGSPVYSSKTREYDYLILCPDFAEQILIPYTSALSKIGIRSRIISYQPGQFEDIEVVREIIRNEYFQSGIEYLALIGSPKKEESTHYVIPMKEYVFEYEDREFITYSDMVYASILDPEGTLDLYIGRIPFETPEEIMAYLERIETFWKQSESLNKNVLLTGVWQWMKHCSARLCPLQLEDENRDAQPPIDTVLFHLRDPIDKADLIEQIVPQYFPEEYSLYRLYELEGLLPSLRKMYADDTLNEDSFIKYYNETNPAIVLLSGALDQSIGSLPINPAIYRKIWKEDINHDNLPNKGEMGYPIWLTDKSIQRLKPGINPIVISDAGFVLNPTLHSIGQELIKKGAIGLIGNTGYGVTTYQKNDGGVYENGPFSSIYLESLILKGLRSGYPIGKAYSEMMNHNVRMNGKNWSHYSMNYFGDPLLGFYNLPLTLEKTLIRTNPVDGEMNFKGNLLEIQFNHVFIQTKKDLQDIKDSILITDLFTNRNIIYTPSWDETSRTLQLTIQNELPSNTWFSLRIPQTSHTVYFHTTLPETKQYFDLPIRAKIIEASFGYQHGVPSDIAEVTTLLNSLIDKGEKEISIDQSVLVSLPDQKNYLYLTWEDEFHSLFKEQLPEGTVIRITEDKWLEDQELNEYLNTLLASYYNNSNLLGEPVFQEKTKSIHYDWGMKKPNAIVNQDEFSIAWKGLYEFVEGNYRFTYASDDGLIIKVDGKKLVEQWFNQPKWEKVKRVKISEGKHLIEIFYYDRNGYAGVEVKWEKE